MSAQSIDLPALAEPSRDRTIRLHQYFGNRWAVEIAGNPAGRLSDLKEALAFAKRECGAAPATIEMSFEGMLCVVQQDVGWRRAICAERLDSVLSRSPARRRVFRERLAAWRRRPTGSDNGGAR